MYTHLHTHTVIHVYIHIYLILALNYMQFYFLFFLSLDTDQVSSHVESIFTVSIVSDHMLAHSIKHLVFAFKGFFLAFLYEAAELALWLCIQTLLIHFLSMLSDV